MKMECNVGNLDRILRILVGIPLSIYAVTEMNLIAGIISLLLLSTAIMKSCTSYQLLGVNTGCYNDTKYVSNKRNLVEGFAISASVYLIVLIIYFIVKYAMLVSNS